jgi:hypothetical protein
MEICERDVQDKARESRLCLHGKWSITMRIISTGRFRIWGE